MDQKTPIVVTAGTVQDTLYAAMRLLLVLFTGFGTLVGFIGKHDLAGLVNWIKSDDFVPIASALALLITTGWGLVQTHRRKKALVEVAHSAPDNVATVVEKGGGATALGFLPFALLLMCSLPFLAGCTTTGADTVRLNANKAFYTAQVAFKASQQTVLIVCTNPQPALVTPCQKSLDVLKAGADAEAAGFTAQQAGNSADLQTAIVTLTALPAQLAALGVLEAK